MDAATIRCAATLAVLAAARARGLDVRAITAGSGGAPLPEDPRATIALSTHFAVFAACMRAADDPAFPIEVAQQLVPDAYDVVGFAMRSAPTLLDAMEVSRRFQALYASDASGAYETEVDARHAVVRFRPSGALPLAARCATESAIAQVVHIGRTLAGGDLRVEEVTFRHPRPRSTARHDAFFGVAPSWSAPLTTLRLPRAELERPVVHADPTLHAFLHRTAEDALRAIPQRSTLTEGVRRALLSALPTAQSDLPRVARRLGMSPRTLRRRLEEEDITFTRLRDEVRRELAERYLAEQKLPIEEIAFLLDFADERAFRRSFQRWTGASPAAFRKRTTERRPR